MNKIYLLALLAFLCAEFSAMSQNKNEFEIYGIVKGIGSNTIVRLGNKPKGYPSGFKIKYYDSCTSKNDSFYFKGFSAEPTFYSIEIDSSKGWLSFVISNSRITITGSKDSIFNATVNGSKEHSAYLNYRENILSPLLKNQDRFWDKIDKLQNSEDSVIRNIYKDSLKNILEEIYTVTLDYIAHNPSEFVSLERLYYLTGNIPSDTAKKYYSLLSNQLKSHSLGKKIKYKIFDLPKQLQETAIIPPIIQYDTLGNPVKINQYKGKYVLLDYWASWCGPCIEELPMVKQLYNQYKSKPFEVIGISLDYDKQAWTAAIQKWAIPWQNISDLKGADNEAALIFGINAIPQKILISPDGTLLLKTDKLNDVTSLLQSLFK